MRGGWIGTKRLYCDLSLDMKDWIEGLVSCFVYGWFVECQHAIYSAWIVNESLTNR
jgi:hypothetical protein